MEFAEIATFAFQTVVTVLIGAVGWGIKNALNELKKSLDDLKSKTKDNEAEIKAVRGELNDLKADLPLVYVLREDFIRVLNNVDTKLDKLIGSSKEGKWKMGIMDEMTEHEVDHNKAIRGYIIRALIKGNQNALLVRQITNALVADGLVVSPDISKHLDYLVEAGYIVFTERTANAYTAYRKDAVIKLTRKGVDLVECTIDDAGVDV